MFLTRTTACLSRAVCHAKRSLEILDRLGLGDAGLRNKGVSWSVGRTFLREEEVYRFNLVLDATYKRPGMINLQQYHLKKRWCAAPRLWAWICAGNTRWWA